MINYKLTGSLKRVRTWIKLRFKLQIQTLVSFSTNKKTTLLIISNPYEKQQTLPFTWNTHSLRFMASAGFYKKRQQQYAYQLLQTTQHRTTPTANSPSRGPRTQRGDFLYLTAWVQVRTTAKWQIADCRFSSSGQSNKCEMKSKHTPSWAQGGREVEWRLSPCQQ